MASFGSFELHHIKQIVLKTELFGKTNDRPEPFRVLTLEARDKDGATFWVKLFLEENTHGMFNDEIGMTLVSEKIDGGA